MPGTESPIFARSYALLHWLIPLTVKFPRQQRFVLAAATQQTALRFHERLIEAARAPREEVATTLAQADVEIEKLRHYLRLCHDLELLTTGQYEHAAELVSEIGKLLGGWRNSAARPTNGPTSGQRYAKRSPSSLEPSHE